MKQNGGHDEGGDEGKENDCAGQRTAIAFQHAETAVRSNIVSFAKSQITNIMFQIGNTKY